MRKNTYLKMLTESLIDISSMQNYDGPAKKVLDAKDEKYETFRSVSESSVSINLIISIHKLDK